MLLVVCSDLLMVLDLILLVQKDLVLLVSVLERKELMVLVASSLAPVSQSTKSILRKHVHLQSS